MHISARIVASVLGAALLAAGLFVLGRVTAPTPHRHATTEVGDYFDGLRVGEAQGRAEGRAIQEGAELPKNDRRPVHDAFRSGYTAGTNDAFAGYDGGWALHVPWIVTIEEGSGQVAYRIKDRTQVEPGVDYFLCPDGRTLCHRKR